MIRKKKVLVSNIKKSKKNGAGKDFPFMDEKAVLGGKGARSEEIVFPASLGKGKRTLRSKAKTYAIIQILRDYEPGGRAHKMFRDSIRRALRELISCSGGTHLHKYFMFMDDLGFPSVLPAYCWCKEVVVA